MAEGTQRKLAAFVAADVVGYSRLMGDDESGTLAAMGIDNLAAMPSDQAGYSNRMGTQ